MLSFKQILVTQAGAWILLLAFLIPLAALLTGCDNSCIAFVSNPGGGVGTGAFSSPCPVPTPHGSVQAAAQLSRQCESCSPSNQIQGIFVSLRGVEIHLFGESPSDWQELYPALEVQPRQFNLLAAGPDGPTANPLGDAAAVPAGTYDLVRLRLASNHGPGGSQLASENACGQVGLNCVAMGDGRILPLLCDGDALELRVSSAGSANGLFSVIAESHNQLLIELTPVWSLVAPVGESAHFSPLLRGAVHDSSARLW